MKKLLLLLLTMLIATTSMAATLINGIYYNLNSSARTAEVTSGSTEYSGAVSIPSKVTYNGTPYSVTSIGNDAFYDCSELASITIPTSVTWIGREAFSYCTSLTSITIPNSVTSIGDEAFYRCRGLTTLTIGNSVTSIGDEAFLQCWKITSITIPNSVTSIGEDAFSGCSAATSLSIGSGLINFDISTFSSCINLSTITVASGNTKYDSRNNCNAIITKSGNSLILGCKNTTIPSSVTSIGDGAFSGCSGLTSITIPNSVTSIGDGAFSGCSGLTSITIPNSVTSIGGSSFSGCSGLTSIEIPNSVTSVGNYAFNGCSNMTSVVIGSGVRRIGDSAYYNAFKGCTNLTSITVDTGNTQYDSRNNCNAIIETSTNTLFIGIKNTVIPNSVTSIGSYAFSSCSGLTSIDIPNSVTSIGSSAFSSCNDLTAVVIGSGVTSISPQAFYPCSNLTSVTVNNPTPVSISSTTFSNRANATLYVPCGAKAAYKAATYWKDFNPIYDTCPPIIFADANVKAICVANWDLNGDGELSESEAAEVTDLGSVFNSKSNITSFDELQYFTGLTSIEGGVFQGCTGLASIYIPSGVTSIDWPIFRGCTNLTTITVSSENTKYDSRNNCNAIIYTSDNTLLEGCKNTIIPNTVTRIAQDAFHGCTGLSSIDIPSSVTSIEGGAFQGCTGLSSITIPGSVTSIGASAFNGCTWMSSLIISNGVTSIGVCAFQDCSRVKSVNIPNSVTSIGTSAFIRSGLNTITIGQSVTSIGDGAFAECSSLNSITVASGNTKYDSRDNSNAIIEKSTNELILGCRNTVIPSSVTSIKSGAFYGSGITAITIPASVTSIGDAAFSDCYQLTSVTVENPTPVTITIYVFTNRKNATLYVPYGSKSAYEAADYWKEFKEIIEIDNRPEQTLSYSEIPAKTYGDAAFTLPVTTTEELTITWTSSNTNVATISGNTMTIKGAGTATITATQAGNNSYKPFTKDYTLTVNKAALTITAKSYTIKQGDAMPTFEATYTGFKNNETASVLTTQPTFSCNATSASAPGTYDITVSGATADNYSITFAKGTLTITQADPVTVTANSYTIQYGDAIPTLGYTSQGTTLNGTPSLSCSATTSSPAGTYPITITTGSVSNHNVTYVAGTLTITKAPLTITAKNYTIMQGDAMPTFEATYSGFKNNDDENILTTAPTFSCSATSASAPGTYEIVMSGAASDRYDITKVNGTLTIDAAIATITIPAEGMTTYCPEYDLDFSGETDFKAYIIVGYNKKTSKVVAVEVSEVPAGMGLYLKGKPGTYEVPAAETESYFLNMLKGVTTATTIPATNGDFTNLTLSAATKPTFVAASDGSSVAANTAYLQIETAKYNGQPAEILLVGSGLVGDINKDGDVSISDVTTLVNMILGKE